ncbi:hypothetical protein MHYP_G00032950 [Metynnis hypsauchen]
MGARDVALEMWRSDKAGVRRALGLLGSPRSRRLASKTPSLSTSLWNGVPPEADPPPPPDDIYPDTSAMTLGSHSQCKSQGYHTQLSWRRRAARGAKGQDVPSLAITKCFQRNLVHLSLRIVQ